VTVHSRRSQSGVIDGLSDVNRYDNFCDPTSLHGYDQNGFFEKDAAMEHQLELLEKHQIVSGPSSGAAYWLAREVKAQKPEAKIAFISACGKPL